VAQLAHFADPGSGAFGWWVLALCVAVAALVVEHHVVAGFDRVQVARRGLVAVAFTVIAALGAVALPAGAQPDTASLPDLISDPPRPSYFGELNTADGGTRLVVTFDGYVHNIGAGPLDVVGNPQEPGGMEQRVRDGDGWVSVGSPTVRFETDDGHNHFHLIEAVEYVLWNEMQGSQTAVGSKIGFCLVDSEVMEPGNEQAYSEELDNFCQENNPGATSLRMGISPGWRDVYDATTTLQWVDVSDTPPGRYWIGAITDPNDEILESDETNNDLIFSDGTISVPGFAPRGRPPVPVEAAMVEVELPTTVHGTVTTPVYVIEEGPTGGVLDVPIGSDLGSSSVRYYPDPEFEGTDRIVFSVRDASSPYPFDAPTETIELQVEAGAGSTGSSGSPAGAAPTLVAESTFFESNVGESFSTQVVATGSDGDAVRVYASGLPAGLVVDPESGTIDGIARQAGIFDVTLFAIGDDPTTPGSLDVTWIVNAVEATGGVGDVADRSSPYRELTRVRVGTNRLGLTLQAEGLPPGLELRPGSAVVEGTPSEIGTYQVTINEIDQGQTVAATSFTWTIRPAAVVEFVL